MKRKKMRKRKDKRVFSKTAGKTKKINVNPSEYRGGIRLWFKEFIQLKTKK